MRFEPVRPSPDEASDRHGTTLDRPVDRLLLGWWLVAVIDPLNDVVCRSRRDHRRSEDGAFTEDELAAAADLLPRRKVLEVLAGGAPRLCGAVQRSQCEAHRRARE